MDIAKTGHAVDQQRTQSARMKEFGRGTNSMAKFVILVALAALGFVATVTITTIPPQKAVAECSPRDC